MIEFAKGLDLPNDAVTQTIAFIGRKGSGKTYSAGKLIEGLVGIGAQVIVIDPVGVYWGLRLGANGSGRGIDIPILGGQRGDMPLTEDAGALIADFAVENRRSMILDVSMFRKAARVRFITAFAEQIFHIKKAHRTPLHIVIEEAHKFIPQQKQRGEEAMVGAWEDIIRLGRNYGIGVTMISQRPQSINKEVLNQTECLVCHQITGAHERKAIADWVVDRDLNIGEMVADLPGLAAGEAYLWSPAWLRTLQKIKVRKKKTYDASSTPQLDGDYSAEAKPLAKLEIENLTTAMESTIQEAKANDPRVLKKRIRELEAALAGAETVGEPDPAVIEDAVLAAIEDRDEQWDVCIDDYLRRLHEVEYEPPGRVDAPRAAKKVASRPPPLQPYQPRANVTTSSGLPTGEAKILAAAIQFGSVDRTQLTVLTGYKRSSRDTYLQRLKQKGLIEVAGQAIVPTDAGRDAVPDAEPLPTGRALRDYWLGILPTGERAILGILIDAYPNAVDRDEISEATGYQRSSRDTYLQRLSQKKLVDKSQRGVVSATEILFMEADRRVT